MKKTLILIIIFVIVISVAVAEKMIYQEFKVLENPYQEFIYKTYISLYNIRTDIIQVNKTLYTYLTNFENYPNITHISINHSAKKYYTQIYNIEESSENSTEELKSTLKNLQIQETTHNTIINDKNVPTIKYILFLQNSPIIEISISQLSDILQPAEINEYKKIYYNSKFNKFIDSLKPFENIDFFKKLKSQINEGFVITEVYSHLINYKQIMTSLNIIEQQSSIFNIPLNYEQQK